MKPIDKRNTTWGEIQARLEGDRLAVYEALRRMGPSTTRQLATRMAFDPFSVRPRVTELFQLGLVRLLERDGREGVYEAIHIEEARGAFESVQRGDGEQLLMGV